MSSIINDNFHPVICTLKWIRYAKTAGEGADGPVQFLGDKSLRSHYKDDFARVGLKIYIWGRRHALAVPMLKPKRLSRQLTVF